MSTEVWYRFVDSRGEHGPSVHLCEFEVRRHTPGGVWLDVWGREKWVSNNSRKRFAYPTVEEAERSFRIRKERQMAHIKAQALHVWKVLGMPEWPCSPELELFGS